MIIKFFLFDGNIAIASELMGFLLFIYLFIYLYVRAIQVIKRKT